MSSGTLLDASALLALVFREPGHEQVAEALPAAISTVNLTEVVSKLRDRGVPPEEAVAIHLEAGIDVVPFGVEAALRAGLLRDLTRPYGLSLGDRCCLATAQIEGFSILTADAAWESLAPALGLSNANIRPRRG